MSEVILTENRHLKYIFTDKELLEISRKRANAALVIGQKLEAIKTYKKQLENEIEMQQMVVDDCDEKTRSGYEMRPVECTLKYENNEVSYYRKDTGEFVESRPITKEEQLMLSGNRVDAEHIIRQARKEEDTEDEG